MPIEMNNSPFFSSTLVHNKVFSDDPLVIVDVGARDGIEDHWTYYEDQVAIVAFEPDQGECARLNAVNQLTNLKYHPVALSKTEGMRTFYVTRNPQGSSFYPADFNIVSRFPDEENLTVLKTEEIEVTTFDSFAKANKILSVDFMKLDCEGSELDILEGANDFLNGKILGISVECIFQGWRQGAPRFSEVDAFLRGKGFNLYAFSHFRHSRKSLPLFPKPLHTGEGKRGQVIWGQFLYFRDPIAELKSGGKTSEGWSVKKLLKIASLMELFSLHDCAMEVISHALSEDGKGESLRPIFLDLLMPLLEGQRISYSEYLNLCDIPFYKQAQ